MSRKQCKSAQVRIRDAMCGYCGSRFRGTQSRASAALALHMKANHPDGGQSAPAQLQKMKNEIDLPAPPQSPDCHLECTVWSRDEHGEAHHIGFATRPR